MKRLRILFITGEYPPLRGGIADYLQLLRRELQTQGVRSIVLSCSGSEGSGVSTVPKWGWKVVGTIRKLVGAGSVDVVHIQYQTGAFNMHPVINALPRFRYVLSGVPVVTTFHDLRAPYLFPKAGRLRPHAVVDMARNSSAIVVTNPQDGATLSHKGISSIDIPVGPSLPAPDSSVSPGKSNTVGYFGFPSREKGILSLIDAIGMIEQRRRPKLKIVGALKPDTGRHGFVPGDELEVMARKRGVVLQETGYLQPQEASNELNRCQVIAFPFSDGASLRSSAMIAALNTGRPVVVTVDPDRNCLGDIQSLNQLITVPTGDVPGFSKALQRTSALHLVADRLPERFQWRFIAEHHLDMYRSITSGRRA